MTRRLYLAVVIAIVGGLLLAAGAPGQPAAPALTAIEPDTFIDSPPIGTTSSSTATFTFHSDDPSAGFTCYLDGVALGTCSSPSIYTGLANGSHTFDVQAIGLLGTDPTPAHEAWTIDSVAPETTITSPPIGTTSSSSATFTFTSSEPGSTFECRRNGHKILPCSSPKTYSALANGTHTFRVWATDPSGNEDATPASQTWTIDSVAPQTTMTSGPPARRRARLQPSPSAPAKRAPPSSAGATSTPLAPARRPSRIPTLRTERTPSRCGRPTRPASRIRARPLPPGPWRAAAPM